MSPVPPMQLSREFYVVTLPILILCVGCIVSMLQAVTAKFTQPASVFNVLSFFLLVSLGSFFASHGMGGSFLNGAYLADSIARLSQILILSVAIVLTFLAFKTYIRPFFFRAEVASLFQMSLLGMLVMVASADLVTLFIGLELSSIALYALVGYVEPSRFSQEGAIKYFILGSFASALLLMGFGLLYATTGSLKITGIAAALRGMSDLNMWVLLGGGFTIFGLAFKLALAPFHGWSPDAYEAAPTMVTAFMATCVKVMVMVVTMRVFDGAMSVMDSHWYPLMSLFAVLSMLIGNVMALVQSSLKRMLAYSAISHSGYMAIALCAMGSENGESMQAIFFYLIGYAFSSVLAFGILMWLEDEKHSNLQLEDLAGLAKVHPWAAFGLATAMFSFAGMPPTVGFFAKFFVFAAALKQELYLVVIMGALASVIALYYYLRVIVKMYMTAEAKGTGRSELSPVPSSVLAAILFLAFSGTILLGTIFPGYALDSIKPFVEKALVSK